MNLELLEKKWLNKRICIIRLEDPVDRYAGKEGIVKQVALDPWGDLRLDGTWGGIGIYPKVDEIEVIS